jgi:hypothetical protein
VPTGCSATLFEFAPVEGHQVAAFDGGAITSDAGGQGGGHRRRDLPRFIVTSPKPAAVGAQHLYEVIYCARGEMENRIKECQLDLFADRTSAATVLANQLRLIFLDETWAKTNMTRLYGGARRTPSRPHAVWALENNDIPGWAAPRRDRRPAGAGWANQR